MQTATAHTINEAAAAIRSRRMSSVELVERCLDTIARREGEINAFIRVLADDARESARRADREIPAGHDRGVLHGIPLSVKDLVDLEGLPTTAASRVRDGHRAPMDAVVLRRLRDAGVIFIGKCNLHEFAFGTTGEDSAFGATRNPHAPGHLAGGSSSGSAASVAAGMALASVGTDTGGSIRIPAAACGVVGLKPTFGELSCDGVVPLAASLDHVGPLARTVADVAIVFQVMGGQRIDVGDYPSGLGAGHRQGRPAQLALPREYFLDVLDTGVREAFDGAIARLRKVECRIEEVAIAQADLLAATYRTTVLYEAFRFHAHNLQTRPCDYLPNVRERLEMGRKVSEEAYHQAQQDRKQLCQSVDAALQGVEALVLPTLPIVAPPLGMTAVEIDHSSYGIRELTLRLTQLFDLTGHPAISLPCGTTAGGLPCGLQLVGRRGETLELLAVAARYEKVISAG